MESGSRIGGLIPNVEKEVINGATETNLVDERLKQTNQNSNLNKVVNQTDFLTVQINWFVVLHLRGF